MMNDIILHDVTFKPSNNRRYFPRKSDKLFTYKQNSIKNRFENKPLISTNSDSCSDDEITPHDIRHLKNLRTDGENSSLRKINKNDSLKENGCVSSYTSDPFRQCELKDLKIEEGDTLQSISIKYHCSISDIKRANHLISNQEFYALKYIKIPVKRHGLLTEIIPPVHKTKHDSKTVEELENNVQVINIGIGGRSPSPQETATFFKRMDEDLVKIMLSTQTRKESLEAAAAVLTTPQIQPLVKDPYNTADCGIQWNYLLIFVILFAVVIPTIVALYMYMRPLQVHHHDFYASVTSNDSFSSVPKLSSIKAKS